MEITFINSHYGVYAVMIDRKWSSCTIDQLSSNKWQVYNNLVKNRDERQIYTARTLKKCKEWSEKNLAQYIKNTGMPEHFWFNNIQYY